MPTPFESFVNTELPLRISTQEDGGGTGNLPAGMALRTTGDGLSVETAAWPGSSTMSIWTAGVDVNGHRAVVTMDDGRIRHADPSIVSDAHRILGLSLTAGLDGANITVLESGLVTELSWSWVPDAAIFVGTDGLLTQVQPASGFSMILGFAPSPTSLYVRPCRSILLAA